MYRLAAIIVAFAAVATARMAYQLPSEAEFILRAGSYQETFTCEGRSYGYYADTDNNCEIFHVCLPIEDDTGAVVETAHFSFLCGNQTVFSQDSLVCASEAEAFPCEEAASLYDASNADFGVVLDEKRRR